jgi:hypothetical protein
MAVQRIDDDILHQLAEGVLDGGDLDVAPDIPQLPASDGSVVYEYPDVVKQLAFTLWAFEAGRNISQTRRLLKDRAGVDIPGETIRIWRGEGRWPELQAGTHQTLSQSARVQVASLLAVGTVRAARWAVGVFDDPNVTDTVKGKMAMTLLSRGGFPEAIRGEVWDGVNGRVSMRDIDAADLDSAINRYLEDADNQVEPERRALTRHEESLQVRHIISDDTALLPTPLKR